MDIVERLRNPSPPNIQFVMYEWMKEAADEIERLREDRGNLFHAIGYALDLLSDGFDNATFETLQDAWDVSLKEKE